jgi:hypothetical protein
MRTLVGEVFDERVRPVTLARATDREGGNVTRPPTQKRLPGAIQETEKGFYIFNNIGKLQHRVPEDWMFPHYPL